MPKCGHAITEKCECPHSMAHGRTTYQRLSPEFLRVLGHHARSQGNQEALGVIERLGDESENPSSPSPRGRRTQQRVNAARIWRQMAEHTYPNADLPFIATREALQNGIDAIKRLALFASWAKAESMDGARGLLGLSQDNPQAHAGASIREGFPTVGGEREVRFREWMKAKDKVLPDRSKFLKEGRFTVEWNPTTATLTWGDNGIGMTADILDEKFLVLGETGKTEGGAEGEVGGFGIAKAVILGVGSKGWRMQTRNVVAEPVSGLEVDISIAPESYPGTEVASFGVPGENRDMAGLGYDLPILDRLRYALAASEVGDIQMVLDGEAVEPFFPKDRGTVLKQYDNLWWGANTTVRIKRYRRMVGSGGGAFYVRLGGLFQFAQAPEGEAMKEDIILDVTTSARPEDKDYPFTPSRESFRGPASSAFYSIRRTMAVDQTSSKDDSDYDVFLPDATDPKERAGAQRFADQMAEMVEDPSYRDLVADLLGQKMENWKIEEAGGGIDKILGEGTTAPGAPTEEIPSSSEAGWGWVIKTLPAGIDKATSEDTTTKAAQVIGHIADWAEKFQGSGALADAANELQTRGYVNAYTAQQALDNIADIAKALGTSDQTTASAIVDTGLAAGAALGQIAKLIEDAAAKAPWADEGEIAEVRKKRSKINPFGTAALVKVSRENFDPDAAKAFRRRASKYIPMLVAWESTAKLIALEYDNKLRAGGLGVKKKTFERKEERSWGTDTTSISASDVDRAIPPFRVGFILDDTCLAMASNEPGHGKFLLVHPERLSEVVEHHGANRPWAIAGYLHATICHELAHLPRMGKGHNENYVIAREDIDVKTTHLLPVIERIVRRAFKIKSKVPPGAESAVRSAAWKATKAANDKWAKDRAMFQDEIARLKEAGVDSAEVAALEARAAQAESALYDAVTERRAAENKATSAEARAQAIVSGRIEPILANLAALAEYGEFRNFLLVHGHRFLPTEPGLFVSALESMPEAVDIVVEGLRD